MFTSELRMARTLPRITGYRRVPMALLAAYWPTDDLGMVIDVGDPDALADDRHAPVPAGVHALAEGEVLVPQADEPSQWQPGAAVPVPVVRRRREGPFVPVFTSEAAMAAALSYTTPCERVWLGVLAAVRPGDVSSASISTRPHRRVSVPPVAQARMSLPLQAPATAAHRPAQHHGQTQAGEGGLDAPRRRTNRPGDRCVRTCRTPSGGKRNALVRAAVTKACGYRDEAAGVINTPRAPGADGGRGFVGRGDRLGRRHRQTGPASL
ncbi:SseB family protein [Streptomyces sp. UG1]|uniref:SseB family protein n=1 Tax=Streptomyces sp. UG1 TaxID=3417652 RepID=UPI003CEDEC2C